MSQDRLSFVETLSSVFAAFFGVQSSKNRQRDFKRGSPAAFFLVGLLFTVGFVITLILLVKLILRLAT